MFHKYIVIMNVNHSCRCSNQSLSLLQCNYSKILLWACSITNRSISYPENRGTGRVIATGSGEPSSYCLDPVLVSGILLNIYHYLSASPLTQTTRFWWQTQNPWTSNPGSTAWVEHVQIQQTEHQRWVIRPPSSKRKNKLVILSS